MRTIKPLRDNIIVKQDPPKEKLESGLFLPSKSKDLYEDVGTVIAIGSGKVTEDGKIIAISVKVGDRVAFKRRPASHLGEMAPEWDNLLMLKDEDIIGVLDENE